MSKVHDFYGRYLFTRILWLARLRGYFAINQAYPQVTRRNAVANDIRWFS